MIAFYVWTDTLLMNAFRIKAAEYRDEPADLLVLDLRRVSRSVVAEIEKTGVFRRILFIRDVHEGKRSPLHKAMKLFSGEAYYRAVRSQLSAIDDCVYDTLFVGGLWADALFVYRCMSRNNAQLRVALMEEGIVNYGGMKTALWCDAINRKRDFLFRRFFYGRTYKNACAALKALYLAEPEACLESGPLELHRICQDPPGYRALAMRLADEEAVRPYRERRVVFYMQPESEEHSRITMQIVGELAKCFSPEQVLVRAHPDTDSVGAIKAAWPGVYVDMCEKPFEAVANQVDWSGKVLVARASSCMFYPRFCRGQQPDLYYMYMLFEHADRSLIEPMVRKIRTLYTDAGRVRRPDHINEFQKMLAAHRCAGEKTEG